MTVEGAGERRGTHKGHRPTFTRAHTPEEIKKISEAIKRKPKRALSMQHADNISRGMSEYWKRKKAQQAQEAHNAAQEETFFTPDTNTGQSK